MRDYKSAVTAIVSDLRELLSNAEIPTEDIYSIVMAKQQLEELLECNFVIRYSEVGDPSTMLWSVNGQRRWPTRQAAELSLLTVLDKGSLWEPVMCGDVFTGRLQYGGESLYVDTYGDD